MYAKLRLPPHIRSFSRCSFRQTAILGGSDGRIEPNYFLYRDVNFLAEKKSCFFGSPECVWLLRASPAVPGPKKPGKYQKYRLFMKNPKIVIFPEIVISGSAAPGPKGPLNNPHTVRPELFLPSMPICKNKLQSPRMQIVAEKTSGGVPP